MAERKPGSMVRKRLSLGQLLLERQLVTAEELNTALATQKKTGDVLG